MAVFTKTYHRSSYPAISPTLAQNRQTGRTVLISGGSSGIGFGIARAFVQASAQRVIILGRRADALSSAVEELQAEVPIASAPATAVLSQTCDVASKEDVRKLWAWLASNDMPVDILVLNAAHALQRTVLKDMEAGLEGTVASFEVNVFSNLRMTSSFLQQGHDEGKVLLNISSAAVHANPAPRQAAYSASKAGMATLFQHLADEVDPRTLQILNIHPGAVFTEAAERHGFTKDSLPWDDVDLVGAYCVWASTKAATLLHGKFVWVNWDVGELTRMVDELSLPGFLRVGLQGPPEYFDGPGHFAKIRELECSEAKT